jgi:homoserine O-succinyltransferase
MTVVVPKDYHIKDQLESSRVQCVTDERASREDIRALHIGILNIMPQAEKYEFSLLRPLGRSVMQIEPVWIRLNSHAYSSSNREHMANLYVPFQEAIDKQKLDGLILTGAPVEEMPFEEITYWDEIKRILKYARSNITSTLGMCWGGLALAKFMGIDSEIYPKKIFGVYETRNLDISHRITGDMDDVFWCPQSRHSGIADKPLEDRQAQGDIKLLAHASKGGYVIFESTDHRFVMHLGHLEYDPERLTEEYERDVKQGRTDVDPPENLDMKNPINRWRGNRTEFFSQWIKYIHETNSF